MKKPNKSNILNFKLQDSLWLKPIENNNKLYANNVVNPSLIESISNQFNKENKMIALLLIRKSKT